MSRSVPQKSLELIIETLRTQGFQDQVWTWVRLDLLGGMVKNVTLSDEHITWKWMAWPHGHCEDSVQKTKQVVPSTSMFVSQRVYVHRMFFIVRMHWNQLLCQKANKILDCTTCRSLLGNSTGRALKQEPKKCSARRTGSDPTTGYIVSRGAESVSPAKYRLSSSQRQH